MLSGILSAIALIITPKGLFVLFLGAILGIVFGAVPGLTGTLALALILPFTYALDAYLAFIFMVSLYTSSMYGGSLTAIAINIPGAPGNVCTTLDGHPMYLQGRGAHAMGLATISSLIGGVFSAIVLTIAAPQLAKLAIRFGPPEYFSLTVFGITAVITMGKDKLKGLISGCFGLLLGTMGIDAFSTLRFNFGIQMLNVGMPLLPVVVGLFAFSQVIETINNEKQDKLLENMSSDNVLPSRMKIPGLRSLLRLWKTFLSGAIIGTFIGFLPGAGGSISAFVAYNVEQKFSKHPEKFGTGIDEGLASVETANNATCGGALIPLITLGIPGDQFAAVMLGAFIIHGLPVGPLLFMENKNIVYAIFVTTFISNFVFVLLGYLGSKQVIKAARIRKSLLIPFITLMAITGSFATESSFIHMTIAVAFGFIGYFLKKHDYQAAPIVLGLVLSRLLEDALIQSSIMSRGSWLIFVKRPLSLLFIILSLLFMLSSFVDVRKLLSKSKIK